MAPDLFEFIDQIVYQRSPTLNLLLVMVIIWSTGVICRKIKQPPLLGELLAGIVFGPSLLGIIRPDETLNVLAELGVFFLMFYAGLESNPSHLKKYKRQAASVGIGGYLLPFLMGFAVGRFFGLDQIQSLFIGQALAITAIAVSARVLHDMNFNQFRVAPVIMGAGLIDDIIALTVFTTLIDLAAGSDGFSLVTTLNSLVKVAVFFGVIIMLGLWVLPRMRKHLAGREAKGFTFALIIALMFGFLAEISGLHIIIGAYMAGLLVRENVADEELFLKIQDRFVSITYGFLGPIFFFCLSFHVTFSVLRTHWALLCILLLAAVTGKYLGSFLGARLAGLNFAEASVVGITMNGRGAVELIIASVGLEAGIIDDSLFSILVFIAFITTVLPPLSLKGLQNWAGKRLVAING